ncbi:MAG: hypothetical protein HZA15_10510 [Nitrospirae bacterium]|nr:hypothetical protein [Nitrospirota bacterium]
MTGQARGSGLLAMGIGSSLLALRLSPIAYRLLPIFITLFALPAAAAAETPEKVYVVNDYRYVPANVSDDRDTGLSLCGTRCNALTTDFLNITEVGGWQLMKGAVNTEVTVELNSPFIKGQCICVADEYLVKIDDRYSEERRRPGKRK